MPDFDVTAPDFTIAVLYIIVVMGIGLWISRSQTDTKSYFLGGRGTIWPVIGISMMSANLSGTSFVGLAGAGYEHGIAVWNYEWTATLVLIFFSLFVLPFYLRSKASTMPEFLERRYDTRARKVFAAFSVFTAIVIDSAGALFAGSLTLQLLFPDVPLWTLIAGIAFLGGVYVIFGGLKAVMITDTIQGVLLIAVGTIIFFMTFWQIGSWEGVRQAAPEGGFTIAPPADDDFFPWPGIFTGAIWLSFYYWTTNQVVVQKVLAAKNVDHGRWGLLLAGGLQLPFLFILVLPGLMGREIFPEIGDADQIWPALVFQLLPEGLRGLALAALVAALMSTVDSVLNGSASLVVNDFVKPRKKHWSDARMLLLSRALVGVFMVLAAIWAPLIGSFGGIVEYFQSFLGYITMPVVVVFLGGLFWRQPPRHAAFWTLSIGIPIGVVCFTLFEALGLFDLQFLYGTGLMLLLNLGIFATITLRSEPPKLEAGEDIWSRESWRKDREELANKPLWKSHHMWSALLIVVTLVMVLSFI
ncbi:sodium/solute symporter [Roseinatronobacter sp. S2]|uniref:sodium:solute symporter family transporter n=1 Tax=Roseinatronobacter sp. S2 TaxID=3035471 RepID=UPI00241041EF|nr:sodium/solute symporter [Roseinatronobacter sp. S2]WFE76574.1 sodium/solute symporter [Roseinatronobacter sp. S2]